MIVHVGVSIVKTGLASLLMLKLHSSTVRADTYYKWRVSVFNICTVHLR